MTAFVDTLVSFVATLGLHASVLLGAVWLSERSGLLRHPGWQELAWRGALFGALLSTSLSLVPFASVARGVESFVTASVATPAPANVEAGVIAAREQTPPRRISTMQTPMLQSASQAQASLIARHAAAPARRAPLAFARGALCGFRDSERAAVESRL